jgi:hypothetical protein
MVVFKEIVHVHRVFDQRIEKEKAEEEKEEDFQDFSKEVPLPNFGHEPLHRSKKKSEFTDRLIIRYLARRVSGCGSRK